MIFVQIINKKIYIPDQLIGLIARQDFYSSLSADITTEEIDGLIAHIEPNKINFTPSLFNFFKLKVDKLSEYIQDILYQLIIERNCTYNSNIPLTSGAWSIYSIVRAYKNANLGKAIFAMKKISSPTTFEADINRFLKEFPDAEKYASVI